MFIKYFLFNNEYKYLDVTEVYKPYNYLVNVF